MRPHFVDKGILPDDEDESADPPEIEPGLSTYWEAWQHLREDRSHGAMGGCSGIYYTAISRYAADHGISGDDLEVFLALVRAMDHEYLDWLASQKPEQPASKPPEFPTSTGET